MRIDRAARDGVAVIALRRAGHLGCIGDWAEMAAADRSANPGGIENGLVG